MLHFWANQFPTIENAYPSQNSLWRSYESKNKGWEIPGNRTIKRICRLTLYIEVTWFWRHHLQLAWGRFTSRSNGRFLAYFECTQHTWRLIARVHLRPRKCINITSYEAIITLMATAHPHANHSHLEARFQTLCPALCFSVSRNIACLDLRVADHIPCFTLCMPRIGSANLDWGTVEMGIQEWTKK